ncbi:MAG: YceI family protein [Pseudomonadota bacterium]
MKSLVLAAAIAASATATFAADTYTLDSSHSQIVFSYDHLGFSTTYGMFSVFAGELTLDSDNPANSSVSVSMPTSSMFTGWEAREGHFMSPDLLNAGANELVTFTSTNIEVTGDETALITGDLTLAGVTKSVVLDAKLNKMGKHPQTQQDWAGFDATTTLVRSDFGLGMAAPFISDEVEVQISIEAMKEG